jgi:hypothetical protein
MKNLLVAILITASVSAFGQKNEQFQDNAYPILNEYIKSNPEDVILNANGAHDYLINQLAHNNQSGLKLLSNITSPYGQHYTYIQTYKGVNVYQAIVKLNTDKSGHIISIFSAFQHLNISTKETWSNFMAPKDYPIPSQNTVLSTTNVWALKNKKYVPCISILHRSPIGITYEDIFDINRETVYQLERTEHFTPQDTTAKALVFRPDPITKANTVYGGNFIDNNDATNPSLDATRDTVDIEITYDNGVFYLENNFVKLVKVSLPLIDPVTQNTPFFYYNRSESGFEDVNVIYHITKQQKYIQSLGFMNLVNYPIEIDCHGFNGADNSVFNSSTTPPSIIFGTGGVDDAEDSDVIIHEYTHAIMHSASPNTNFGTERSAMDEAFGDYMAVSYSSTYDIYQSNYVFNWDGHNEYWNGRLVTSSAVYPGDLQFNKYADAPMWSSALLRIERNIGRDQTTVLALQAAYSYTSNMTMAQAAQIFIQTDANMNGGQYYGEICWTFKDKGMVNSCSVPRPDNMVSVGEMPRLNSSIQWKNSEQFATNQGMLNISADAPFKLYVYDISGKLVYSDDSILNKIELSPMQFNSGTYIYKVTTSNETKTFKILKF